MDSKLRLLLAGRAAKALALPEADAQEMSLVTLVMILEEYAEYRRRDERRWELESRAIRDGIVTREELSLMESEELEPVYAALSILSELEADDAPRTPRIRDSRPHPSSTELVALVSRLVSVVACQEESLSLMRSELQTYRVGDVDPSGSHTAPLPLSPPAPLDPAAFELAVISAAAETNDSLPASIHSRATVRPEHAVRESRRSAVAEIEGIVSYIKALGAARNVELPAPDLLRGRSGRE